MTFINAALIISLALGFAGVESKLAMTNEQEVKSFCEVMKDPKPFLSKPITVAATANVLYGGTLLTSDQCQAPDISVHYMKDYERESNADALQHLQRYQRQVREAHVLGAGNSEEMVYVGVVFEGRLEKNNLYHVEMAKGDKTVAAWDYQYEYAFVVTRVVSLRPLNQKVSNPNTIAQ